MYELKKNRPLHVLNIALNLVHGSNLAWQQRKAESFTISPFHWGSYRLGYRRSDLISTRDQDRGLSLGTAVAISGAAASPNMGYQSSPLLTFLMTMFNARLGWWLGNPGESGAAVWYKRGPVHALVPLVSELFGFTDDRNAYVLDLQWRGASAGVGQARAAVFALIGSFAESATYVRQRPVASDGSGSEVKLQFEIGRHSAHHGKGERRRLDARKIG